MIARYFSAGPPCVSARVSACTLASPQSTSSCTASHGSGWVVACVVVAYTGDISDAQLGHIKNILRNIQRLAADYSPGGAKAKASGSTAGLDSLERTPTASPKALQGRRLFPLEVHYA